MWRISGQQGPPAARRGKWRPEAAVASRDSNAAGRKELLEAPTPDGKRKNKKKKR